MVFRSAGTRCRLGALALTAGLLAGCSVTDRPAEGSPASTSARPTTPEPEAVPGGNVEPGADGSTGAVMATPDTEPSWSLWTPVGPNGEVGIALEGWAGSPPVISPSQEEFAKALLQRETARTQSQEGRPDDPLFDETVLTLDPDSLMDAPVVLTLPRRGSLDLTTDGGLVLRDRAGTVAGGIAPPSGGARFVVDGPDSARVVITHTSGQPAEPTPVALSIGERGVVSAEWRERSDGSSLFVDPTPWARAAGEAGWTLVWAELLAAHPEVDSPGMHDQLVCHGVGAQDKETWNLEPWRPDVGLLAVMAARCNPRS